MRIRMGDSDGRYPAAPRRAGILAAVAACALAAGCSRTSGVVHQGAGADGKGKETAIVQGASNSKVEFDNGPIHDVHYPRRYRFGLPLLFNIDTAHDGEQDPLPWFWSLSSNGERIMMVRALNKQVLDTDRQFMNAFERNLERTESLPMSATAQGVLAAIIRSKYIVAEERRNPSAQSKQRLDEIGRTLESILRDPALASDSEVRRQDLLHLLGKAMETLINAKDEIDGVLNLASITGTAPKDARENLRASIPNVPNDRMMRPNGEMLVPDFLDMQVRAKASRHAKPTIDAIRKTDASANELGTGVYPQNGATR